MGLFDQIINVASQLIGQNAQGGQNNLVGTLLGLLANSQQSGDAQGGIGQILGQVGQMFGGQNQEGISQLANLVKGDSGSPLQGLVSLFEKSGLGQQAQSWVSQGENLPVSAEQVQQALRQNGVLDQLAQQTGLDTNQLSEQLAGILPNLVNSATPNGQVDGQFDLASIAKQFLGNNNQS